MQTQIHTATRKKKKTKHDKSLINMVVVVDRLRTGEMKKKKIRKGEQVT